MNVYIPFIFRLLFVKPPEYLCYDNNARNSFEIVRLFNVMIIMFSKMFLRHCSMGSILSDGRMVSMAVNWKKFIHKNFSRYAYTSVGTTV